MLNEDYDDLFEKKQIETDNISKYYIDRFIKACKDVGIEDGFDQLDAETMEKLYEGMKPLCGQMLQDKYDNYPDTMEGKTCVI